MFQMSTLYVCLVLCACVCVLSVYELLMCRGHEKPHMNISQDEVAVSALVYASEVAALSAVIGCV